MKTSEPQDLLRALRGPTALFCPCGARINVTYSLEDPAIWVHPKECDVYTRLLRTFPLRAHAEDYVGADDEDYVGADESVLLAYEDYVDDG